MCQLPVIVTEPPCDRFFNDEEAMEHLRAVVAMDPDNEAAQSELDKILAKVPAESGLLETPVKPVLRCLQEYSW